MRKYVVALVGACAFVDVSAQSTVTLFGTLDVNVRYVRSEGQPGLVTEASGALNAGEFGVRGTEDLGGGWRAGFMLTGDLLGDTGTGAANGKFWNRASTINLGGPFGEIRLGRDYTPSYRMVTLFDAFGSIGLGAVSGARQLFPGARRDNSIQYFLPRDLGGVYGTAMYAFGEDGTTADRPGRMVNARLGYASGALDIVVGGGQQHFDKDSSIPFGTAVAAKGDVQKTYGVSGSWDFGVAKLYGIYSRERLRDLTEDARSLSIVIPIGVSEVRVGYDRSSLRHGNGLKTDVDQVKATYLYNLSKRTALYTTAARLSNKDATRLTLPGAAGPTRPGGSSKGAEFGIRHFF